MEFIGSFIFQVSSFHNSFFYNLRQKTTPKGIPFGEHNILCLSPLWVVFYPSLSYHPIVCSWGKPVISVIKSNSVCAFKWRLIHINNEKIFNIVIVLEVL